jgi:hypothetical protein
MGNQQKQIRHKLKREESRLKKLVNAFGFVQEPEICWDDHQVNGLPFMRFRLGESLSEEVQISLGDHLGANTCRVVQYLNNPQIKPPYVSGFRTEYEDGDSYLAVIELPEERQLNDAQKLVVLSRIADKLGKYQGHLIGD